MGKRGVALLIFEEWSGEERMRGSNVVRVRGEGRREAREASLMQCEAC